MYNPDAKTPTPKLDRITTEGVRFTDAHTSDGGCSPISNVLLTGRYARRTCLKRGVLSGSSLSLIESERLTAAGILRQLNYEAGMVGMWKLGRRRQLVHESSHQVVETIDWTKPVLEGPLQPRLSYSLGLAKPVWAFSDNAEILARDGPLRPDPCTRLPHHPIASNNNKGTKAAGFEFERRLPRFREEAASFIAWAAGAGKPWFLYFARLAPNRSVVPNKPFHTCSSASLDGDSVAEVDWAVGEILAALERSGEAENTLLIVTRDKWPGSRPVSPPAGVRPCQHGTWRSLKRNLWERGHRIPCLAHGLGQPV